MREGLRSGRGKQELDLNVDPREKKECSVSRTNRDSRRGCSVRSAEGSRVNASDCDGKLNNDENGAMLMEGDLPSPVDKVKIDVRELGRMESSVEANAYPNLDANASGDNCNGRAQNRRNGKKTEVQTRSVMDSSDMVSVKEDPVISPRETENGEQCFKLESKGSRKSSKIDDSIDSEILENVAVANAEAIVNAEVDVDEGKDQLCKSRRGRKRKCVENTLCLEDDEGNRQTNHLLVAGINGNSVRVLRSRKTTVASEAHLNGEKTIFAGVEKKREVDQLEVDFSRKRSCRTRNCESAPAIAKGNQKKKDRRGRPPKVSDKDCISRRVINQKDKNNGSNKILKHRKAGRITRSSKFLTSQLEVGAQLLNDEKKMVKKQKTYCSKSNEGETSRREEKQAIRDQIIDILKKAGWTIEYRPRFGKNYADAIYVDCHGRQHWSVTKAYRILKEEVQGGVANEQSLAAFILIPDEVLGTLFRITKEGRKKKLTQNGKSHKKSIQSSQRKEKLNSNPKRKKIKVNAHRKRCGLLARSSGKASDQSGDGFIVYDGKRCLLSWMIDLGVISSNAEVQYMSVSRTTVMCEGKITRDGILCYCCGKIVTLLEFESHAGSNLGQPLKHICLASGTSLLQCLIQSWSKLEETGSIGFHQVDVNGDDPNDDTCNICGDGGNLICCDGCPSTFHQSCLNIQKLPSGDWRCAYCSCKFCGTISGKSSEAEMSGHVDDITNVSEFSSCHMCEEKFHLACTQIEAAEGFHLKDLSFCGEGCKKLFKDLQGLIGVRHELEDGFSWTLLRRHDVGKDSPDDNDSSRIEWNSKLAVAFSVMDECFLPIVDARGKINTIRNVVFNCGSNIRRLNYDGFHTFILEKGDELVCAASVRVHGNRLAEMPFIGTRYTYRRKGMCRRLLTAIESILLTLGVETLVIPAISELIETWTNVFGFTPLEESKRREMKCMSMLVFPGTDMLQKPIFKTKRQGSTTSGQDSETSGSSSGYTSAKSLISF